MLRSLLKQTITGSLLRPSLAVLGRNGGSQRFQSSDKTFEHKPIEQLQTKADPAKVEESMTRIMDKIYNFYPRDKMYDTRELMKKRPDVMNYYAPRYYHRLKKLFQEGFDTRGEEGKEVKEVSSLVMHQKSSVELLLKKAIKFMSIANDGRTQFVIFWAQLMAYQDLFDEFIGIKPPDHEWKLREMYLTLTVLYLYGLQEIDDLSDQELVRLGMPTFHKLKGEYRSERICNNMGRMIGLILLEPVDKWKPCKGNNVYDLLTIFRQVMAESVAGGQYNDTLTHFRNTGRPANPIEFDQFCETRVGTMINIGDALTYALGAGSKELSAEMRRNCVCPYMSLLACMDDLQDLDEREITIQDSKYPTAFGFDVMTPENQKKFLYHFAQQTDYSAKVCLDLLHEVNVKTNLYEMYIDRKCTVFWRNWEKIDNEIAKWALVWIHDFFFELYVKQDCAWHGFPTNKNVTDVGRNLKYSGVGTIEDFTSEPIFYVN